ncbi:MAG: phospholipid-binding lipoprotein MlaA [Pseudomonadota bacterium]|nr:phospholipid-binding lipoprotein MlaA [Pseudomonadota bacterium]
MLNILSVLKFPISHKTHPNWTTKLQTRQTGAYKIVKLCLTCVLLCLYNMSYAIYESQTIVIDRLENYNRNAYRMNDTLDKNFVRPAAVGYTTYVPSTIRAGIQNFFNNLRDFITLGNDILQLSGENAMHNVMRIAINSTFGIAGLIDVSSSLGLFQHTNSFGRTLQAYGWKHSTYFVIPLLGPSTVRDAIGIIPDTIFNPTWWIIPGQYNYVSVGLFAINGIDMRAKYLDFDDLLDTSIDPYTTLRDTYLQAHGESAPTSTSDNNNEVNIDNLIDDDSTPESATATKSSSGDIMVY